MIIINKRREPGKLIAYRKWKDSSYSSMPDDVKQSVRESLMAEQGHLCAYCMRRIPQIDGNPKVSIEHWCTQAKNSIEMGLDYRNMLAVCSGNRGCGCKDNMTCDARREDSPLFVNPTKPETLIGIQYHNDGRIYSTNDTVEHDLNDVLNLNCVRVQLPNSRLSVLRELQKYIKNRCPEGDIHTICRRMLDKYQAETDYKTPFVGILLWWLDKKVRCSKR